MKNDLKDQYALRAALAIGGNQLDVDYTTSFGKRIQASLSWKPKKKRGVQCILANTGSWKFGGSYLKMNYIVR